MLVICEDCAKKYNIDVSRIKGRRARFTCNECGHIIIIDKDDISRSLLSGRSDGSTPAPTLDLLKEMEVPLSAAGGDKAETAAGMAEGAEPEPLVKRRNRGVPVFILLVVVMLGSLAGVSLLFGYLYSGHLEAHYLGEAFKREPGLRLQFLLESSLIFGLAGACILFLFCVLARSFHAQFKRQVECANQLSLGAYDIAIDTKGPREIRDLAFALDRIRTRLKSARWF